MCRAPCHSPGHRATRGDASFQPELIYLLSAPTGELAALQPELTVYIFQCFLYMRGSAFWVPEATPPLPAGLLQLSR